VITARNPRTLTLLGALLALAASAMVLADPADAYQCKSQAVWASAQHKLKVVAQSNARKNWQAKVKSQLGLSWSVWSIAQAKTLNCAKLPRLWHCIARARPCNYVVP